MSIYPTGPAPKPDPNRYVFLNPKHPDVVVKEAKGLKIGQLLTIRPSTKRLKELIKLYGSTWRLLKDEHVACFQGQGLFIECPSGEHQRWIRPEDVAW
jgi:hypothetical protein